jgi:protein-tyrosine-phosphatase
MNVLFVCTENIARSPVAAQLFRERLGHDARHQARTAGIAPHAPQRVTTRNLAWAHIVVAMEELHREAIQALWPDHAYKVVVLGVPDHYHPDDPELRQRLAPKIRVLVEELDTPVVSPALTPQRLSPRI